MANTDSAKKRIRQNSKRQARNRRYLSSSRTLIRRTRELIAAGNLDQAETTMREAISILDKAGRKRIVHPQNASRRKGRIMAHLAAAKAAATQA